MGEVVRIYSKEVFIYYDKRLGEDKKYRGKGTTNKAVLARRTDLGYDNLVRIFTREKRWFYENENYIILRLYTSDIAKGGQSFSRKGKGGMKKFIEEYAMKKRKEDYY